MPEFTGGTPVLLPPPGGADDDRQVHATVIAGTPPAPVPAMPVRTLASGDIALNFPGADPRAVAQAVLGDILRLPYRVDASRDGAGHARDVPSGRQERGLLAARGCDARERACDSSRRIDLRGDAARRGACGRRSRRAGCAGVRHGGDPAPVRQRRGDAAPARARAARRRHRRRPDAEQHHGVGGRQASARMSAICFASSTSTGCAT